MLQQLSQRLSAISVKQGVISEEQVEIYSFAYSLLIMQALSWLSMMVVSLLFGVFWESMGYLLFFIPLRTYAGGRHASTPMRCYFTSMIMCTILFSVCIAIGNFVLSWVITLLSIVATIVISCLSPVADPNKPILQVDAKVYKRKATVIAVAECASICLIVLLPVAKMFAVFLVSAQITVSILLIIPKCE